MHRGITSETRAGHCCDQQSGEPRTHSRRAVQGRRSSMVGGHQPETALSYTQTSPQTSRALPHYQGNIPSGISTRASPVMENSQRVSRLTPATIQGDYHAWPQFHTTTAGPNRRRRRVQGRGRHQSQAPWASASTSISDQMERLSVIR